jgi:hypothetical protein
MALGDSVVADDRESGSTEPFSEAKAAGYNVLGDPRPAVTNYVALHQINEGTFPSLAALMRDISKQVTEYGSLGKIPLATVGNTRSDMYLASEAIRILMKDKESDLSKEDIATLNKRRDRFPPADSASSYQSCPDRRSLVFRRARSPREVLKQPKKIIGIDAKDGEICDGEEVSPGLQRDTSRRRGPARI